MQYTTKYEHTDTTLQYTIKYKQNNKTDAVHNQIATKRLNPCSTNRKNNKTIKPMQKHDQLPT